MSANTTYINNSGGIVWSTAAKEKIDWRIAHRIDPAETVEKNDTPEYVTGPEAWTDEEKREYRQKMRSSRWGLEEIPGMGETAIPPQPADLQTQSSAREPAATHLQTKSRMLTRQQPQRYNRVTRRRR